MSESSLLVPAQIDGEAVSPRLPALLHGVQTQLNRNPADRFALREALALLLEFLASPEGRTNANCVATDSVFLVQLREHPRIGELPNDFEEIFFDLGGTLHDTISSPRLAENFFSTPEQLLDRVRRLAH